jgi:hypothetical protein
MKSRKPREVCFQRHLRFDHKRRAYVLDMYSLDLVQTDVVVTPVIELGGARRRMIGHRGGVLERAAVFQIGGDAGRAERVVADHRADAGSLGPALHHRVRVRLRQWPVAELSRAARNGPEQRPFRFIRDAGAVEIRVQVRLERMVTRHLVPLAALLMQAHPQPPLLHIHVVDPHRDGGPNPRERKHHQRDQRAVTQAGRRRHIDAVEQLPRLGCIEHRRAALFRGMGGPAHRRSRVVRHDLAGDEPVEQVADRGQLLLDGRRRRRLGLQLDPRGHVQRLYLNERWHASAGAPPQKIPRRPRVRTPRVRIANRRREEFQEADAGPLAGRRDQGRHHRMGGNSEVCTSHRAVP